MSYWDELLAKIQALVRIGPPEKPRPVPGEPPESLSPRVLLITFNPLISSEGGKMLTQVLGWGDVDRLCQDYIADLRECSDGFLDYQIVQKIEADAWPVKVDGFRYDGNSFLRSWRSKSGFHDPDAVDYEAIIQGYDLLQRIDRLTRSLFAIAAEIRGVPSSAPPEHTDRDAALPWTLDPDRLACALRAFVTVWLILLACMYIPDFPMPPGVIPVAAAVGIQLLGVGQEMLDVRQPCRLIRQRHFQAVTDQSVDGGEEGRHTC
mgnify:CR=1 FL=1